MEAENTAVEGRGWVLATLMRGLKDSAQQNSRVLEHLRHRGLDVEVMPSAAAQRVVFPRAGVKGWSGAIDTGPVEHVRSARFLTPVAQPVLKVTLQLWSCKYHISVV